MQVHKPAVRLLSTLSMEISILFPKMVRNGTHANSLPERSQIIIPDIIINNVMLEKFYVKLSGCFQYTGLCIYYSLSVSVIAMTKHIKVPAHTSSILAVQLIHIKAVIL